MKSNIPSPRSGAAKRKSQVSIEDVAKLAGCAPATVSRRLNNPDIVRKTTMHAIDKAIEELGYVRNASARALRSSRSRLVGAIIPTLRHSIYADIMEGLQRTLGEHGFSLIHNTSNYNIEEEYQQAITLVERGVEAVVLIGTKHKAKTFELFKNHGVTCVATYALHNNFKSTSVGSNNRPKFTSIGFDNRESGVFAANKLYDLGHRRLAMIAGITHNNDRAKLRVEGFLDTLEQRGIPKDSVIVREAEYLIKEGLRAANEILTQRKNTTAIFCGSDILAIGALHACHKHGLRVPDDVSIIGFDDLEIAEFTIPPLSTLRVPGIGMGEVAANHIVHSEPGNAAIRRIELELTFVERASVRPAPQDR